ncbi:uncharacterized protein GLRG_06140 [Colletotrichum graminicola M1.001]|uniref:Uncharacterized protein n=1 Tax=Colletotrichum graminicola (strain M1.001 / M2 / FGSC 10212) TaxID=645133 RepID=E3QJF8_COLGM|nr:uncharacterized protein GLRG_06140 [Colletotrichum graminicola M1.001]EFQ30996.1 hypothetical protein GLRG_06140 [Colletotrichum graminicola M1.001]
MGHCMANRAAFRNDSSLGKKRKTKRLLLYDTQKRFCFTAALCTTTKPKGDFPSERRKEAPVRRDKAICKKKKKKKKKPMNQKKKKKKYPLRARWNWAWSASSKTSGGLIPMDEKGRGARVAERLVTMEMTAATHL